MAETLCLGYVAGSALCCSGLPVDRSVSVGTPAQPPGVSAVPVHGHRVDVRLNAGCKATGELLAADTASLWLQPAPGRVWAVPLWAIERVDIEVYASESAAVAGWTALGTLSSVSHGKFLILSLPVWLITGASMSAVAASGNDANLEPEDLPHVYEYARFPQGLPASFRQQALRVTGCE
jgi:hypothetical protein